MRPSVLKRFRYDPNVDGRPPYNVQEPSSGGAQGGPSADRTAPEKAEYNRIHKEKLHRSFKYNSEARRPGKGNGTEGYRHLSPVPDQSEIDKMSEYLPEQEKDYVIDKESSDRDRYGRCCNCCPDGFKF